jgi:NDP-sugar pyrophosphorylase family protein
MIRVADFIATWSTSLFGGISQAPWVVTQAAEKNITAAMSRLDREYTQTNGIATHASATIEIGAIVKAPAIIGPRAFIAATAYLRGGVFLDEDCIIGPACEIKSTFLFAGSKIAHLSFVGDSLIGAGVNVEAGAIIANYRNEMDVKQIRIMREGAVIDTGVDKFGALIGDGVRIGANAAIAPGAIFEPGARIPRLAHIDQHPAARK